MKIFKVLIVLVIFVILGAVGFYLFSPTYKKDENEGKLNLVLNYTNVTSKMDNSVFVENTDVYLSIKDIDTYYDKYIYYDAESNCIIISKDDKSVCFDISAETIDINGNKESAKVISRDGTKYIPITKLEEVYNIKVYNNSDKNFIVIDSLDRKLETAEVTKNTKVRYKRTTFSRNLEKVRSGDKVAIVPNQTNAKGYTYVRTSTGRLGYIKSNCLSKSTVEREATEEQKNDKKISLVWETFEYSAPKVDSSTVYDGVNVVSPTFLYMDGENVKDKMDDNGRNYVKWAKSKNYEVWAVITNNNYSEEKEAAFSTWINSYEKRKNVINQIVQSAKKYDFDGINIDFENIKLKDKDSLSRFIIELKPALKKEGISLSVDVTEPDGSENWSLCFDRKVIGDVSDYIVFMAYDQFGRGSSKAGPTAACYWVERNINKFIQQEEVKPEKIILGIPFYTILWKEKDGVASGTSILQKSINNNIPSNVEKTWLEDSKQDYVEYEKGGYTYKMWIEDTKATSNKLDYIDQYNLAGAGFWAKGYEDKSVWSIVKEKLLN